MILKDFDLAELRGYEQAKELTVSLLKNWLVKYKFKNWNEHETSHTPITKEDKIARAKEIADKLGDNKIWKSHARPINIEALEELKLKIEDYSDNVDLRKKIRGYYSLLRNFMNSFNVKMFIHTRKFI